LTVYLTYADLPSGIFSSQVIDVVKFLNSELKADVKLVSFISLRNFRVNRDKIKKEFPQAIVFAMFPGMHRWRYNQLTLKLALALLKPEKIIGRSVLATQLAFRVKSKNTKVIYDGRGAIAAEWHEYKVVGNQNLLNEIENLEKDAVLRSDFKIAVSHQLLKYWEDKFGYKGIDYVIIPCTLNKQFEEVKITAELILEKRKALNLETDDVVFIYAGSVAGWQSFELLNVFVSEILIQSPKNKMLFLSQSNDDIKKLVQKFPDQIICKHLKSADVPYYLIVGDYGLLIREETITNKVASPVKFAEYLACGLKVIISNNLGDYSEIIDNNNYIGTLLYNSKVHFVSVDMNTKNKIRDMALVSYTKTSFVNNYQALKIS
jgi:glycosyltransferase involved in cell wall biosynthesis